MSPICSVMVVCTRTAAANSIAYSLQRHGMTTATALTPEEALEKLKKNPCDLVIAESKLNDASGLVFLADVRRLLPLAMRVVYETSPLDVDVHLLISEVAPCAIFNGAIDPERIWKLLALEGPVTHAAMDKATDVTLNPEQIRRRSEELQEENRLLTREILKLRNLQKRLIRGEFDRGAAPPAPGAPQAAGPAKDPREEFVATLSDAFDRMFEDREVVLPVLPAVGLEVQKILAKEDCSFEEVAAIIGLEQGMSARILQVANSPVYAGLERIRNLQQAVSRLGIRETRNLLLAIVAENLFKSRHQRLVTLMTQLWMHSLCCAYSNEHIALSLQIPESDDFFMMGLLHDVGKLLIVHFAATGLEQGTWDAAAVSDDVLREVMARRHNELGARLMEKWQYSNVFRLVARHHNDDYEEIRRLPEPVIVTHFSNLLTRQMGYSLVPYTENVPDDLQLAEALNVNAGTLLRLQNSLETIIAKIRQTYFKGS